ncbi:alpha/beta hydrolase [Paenibacillus sp. SC116]|uniref:alpha/beta fold hydrolase n=1 Tax=Paenibacillus sp. SC116 TaxID=2968986 RepID=UPI00215B53C1|nr:alpha/beta hydrolase [Paenibacillus sp. SC116]MCR8842639.1 alpha/beta hydrolase [Paenibacillus sp. SC116]
MQRYKSSIGKQLIYESYDRLLRSWNVDYVERIIQTSFGNTHMITAGDVSNPPLLLFHGTADNSSMMWVYNAQKLAENYYLIAVDAIGGSGKSEPNREYHRNFCQTVWIDELLLALNIRETYVAGVSYGAYLACSYAIERPDKVKKAVCMAGRVPSSQFEVMTKMMAAFLPEALFPTRKSCVRLLRKLGGSERSVFEQNEELMNHWYYLLKYFNNQSMFKHKIKIYKDTELISLQDKVLFLIGEHDRLANYPKAINKLKQNNLLYKIVPGAGHSINHDQAEIINKEIMQFLC